jgi:hypothetical protein
VENKLEKIMMSWATRYRFGSNKNKAPQFPEDDPKLAKTIRMCQVLYEMFVELTSSKGEEQQQLGNELPSISLPFHLKLHTLVYFFR